MLIALLALLMALAYFSGVANGVTYLYQSAIGQSFGFIYLVLCLTFDSQIHTLCEKSGFILQSSRKKKFEIFFKALGAFVVFTVVYFAYSANWQPPDEWIITIIRSSPDCSSKIEDSFDFKIGLSATYEYSAMLFFLIGMVFGQSYAIQFVQPLLWVGANWLKRVFRTLIGVGLAVCLYAPFYYGVRDLNDDTTRFMFLALIPALTISFLMYGVYPRVCKTMGSLLMKPAP